MARPKLRWFVLGTLLALLLPALAVTASAWAEARAQAKQLAEDHRGHKVAHAGWSFPARVWSDAAPLDLPKDRLVAHAKERGYAEACPPKAPGEVCPKTGEVLPRGGRFPEGVMPPGKEGWTRPVALEPVLLGWLVGPEGEVREHLPLEDAPKHLIDALLISEDEEFYEHSGVNLRSVGRAVIANLKGGGYQQGASTLTMQLTKNLTQQREKTFDRKAREALLAVALERELGKEGVLEMYLDVPYLGQSGSYSICGFQAAARYFFGVDAKDLTLAQAATLVSVLPAPGRYAPDRFPEVVKARRDRLLTRMGEAGYDVADALLEPIGASPHPLPEPRWPAYMQASRTRLVEALGEDVVYGAGLEVFTALDLVAQAATDKLVPERTAYFQRVLGKRGEGDLQSVAVLMKPQSGNIVALWGGDQTTHTDFNRATQAKRQSGSSFKPLVYALGVQLPGVTAATTVSNAPHKFEHAPTWTPRNVGGEYSPSVCLAYGLSWSQNIATASLLDMAGGPEPLIDLASRLGIDTSKFPKEMGLALGQAEVTPLEMGKAVSAIVNGGFAVVGSPILVALDASGAVRLDDRAPLERVLTEEVAAVTRDLMRLVIEFGTGGASRGTGGIAGYGGPAVGKTGTTDDEKDLWFVGGTPDFVGVVWLGYDTPVRIGASASDLASPLWGWWMNAATKGLPQREFEGPKLDRRWICTQSGLLSNGTCRGISAPFLPGTAPKGGCPHQHPPPPPEEECPEGEVCEGDRPHKRESLWQRMAREKAEAEAAALGLPVEGAVSPPSPAPPAP